VQPAKTRVVLVDDHPVLRDGLSFLLGEQPDFAVVGEAEDAGQALEVLARSEPQVVVLDVSLRGGDALALMPELRRRWPGMRILVLSMHEESLYAERLLDAGAHGYVMKQEPPADFLRALRRVAAGEIHCSAAVGQRLAARVRRGAQEALTEREREVLRLVARGLGTQEISRELDMSPKTVDSHRRNIRDKLGLENARDLVRYAVRWAEELPREEVP
jgi:DNA-binding NarL/FixJ family response regulator